MLWGRLVQAQTRWMGFMRFQPIGNVFRKMSSIARSDFSFRWCFYFRNDPRFGTLSFFLVGWGSDEAGEDCSSADVVSKPKFCLLDCLSYAHISLLGRNERSLEAQLTTCSAAGSDNEKGGALEEALTGCFRKDVFWFRPIRLSCLLMVCNSIYFLSHQRRPEVASWL